MLKLYKFDLDMKYVGEVYASKHPLKRNSYILPKRSTENSPFKLNKTLNKDQYYKFDLKTKNWQIETNIFETNIYEIKSLLNNTKKGTLKLIIDTDNETCVLVRTEFEIETSLKIKEYTSDSTKYAIKFAEKLKYKLINKTEE